ncbi:uncharacterized protein C4orf19 homolog [Rhinopithecus roxellana]|uniref:uncharacterized protein C4orf19 homolog n=1 Tax=Rhinopithecus roxellana TaxID=61622 RepID=UPI00123737BE|nr:uncharacterized protein C4orf19 homolog [Rhinopithecus roxellana]XP_010364131.2 uncharacterized protein C4orf19 homolog [Rhinopithecus roxellana]XP_010364132.2 uncharacterized protein C4orf19 homolog [Rhinopithecus roxellana]
MGCRCCKIIQSYLFDPVQVSSPGYVNEVNSCKLDEDDTDKLKGKWNSEVLVQKNDSQRQGSKKTESSSRTANPREPCWPHQGPLPQGDAGGEHHACGINGLGPAAAPQPTGNPSPSQDDRGSWTSTENTGVPPTQPFLEGGGTRKQDCVLLASEGTQVMRNGDSRAPSEAEGFALEVQDHVFQIPAPDYLQHWGPAGDNIDHNEKDCVFKNHTEDESLEGIQPTVGERGLNTPFSGRRSWDSLNEDVETEVLSICFNEKGPAHAMPVVDSGNRQEDAHGSSGDGGGEIVDEDAAVAEALAALEAATAGEDLDEAD